MQEVLDLNGLEVEKDRGVNRVTAVKPVQLVLVSFLDERGMEQRTLALVGTKNATLIDMSRLGFPGGPTRSGVPNDWFTKELFEKLGG